MNLKKLKSLIRHLWLDASDARRAIPPDMLKRLAARVAASESRQTGQIRVCVEAALPMSYLWRLDQTTAMNDIVRQRALMLFGKLRVWDTEQNNGVLVYLLLGEHAIEIVADRGLSQHVTAQQWQAMISRMSATFQQRRFEDGLTQALEEVSALLLQHFPATEGVIRRSNELPDEPFLA
ncbi:MAG: TPM domain-containing protein [Pseudomonadota bacterium]